MVRAFAIGVTVVLLAGACVSVSSPSTGPSVAPSLGVTTPAPATSGPTPTTGSTPTAAATATPEPTQEPTATPTAESTEAPTDEPTTEVTEPPAGDQGDILFTDEMDDDSSGWGVGQSGPVSVAYLDGALQLNVATSGQSVWSTRQLGESYAVLLSAGEFVPGADQAVFGPLCQTPDGNLYGVLVTSGGRLNFVAIENNTTRVLDTHDELDLSIQTGSSVALGVECAGMSSGAFRLVAVMGDGPLAVYQNTEEGPDSFDSVGMYAEAEGDSLIVDVNQAAAYGIAGSVDGMTSEGESLLTHVPGDFQSTCYESPSSGSATAVQHCILQVEGTGAELLQFQSYASTDDMNAAYQENVDQFGVESTGSCQSGPNETTWSLGQTVRGRVQCAPQQQGIRFDWTDDVLAILSTLIDFDGDYQNTYNLWIDAGPVDSPI